MPNIKLCIVGDFLSNKDVDAGGPFRDGRGKMFKTWLRQSGIEPRECLFLNVFNQVPPGRFHPNSFCGPKDEGLPQVKFFKRGKYVKAEYASEIARVRAQINAANPNLILLCGDFAAWALLEGHHAIETSRGRIMQANHTIESRKALLTYSPSQILASWKLRPTLLADLDKAKREQEFADIRRPHRRIHLPESIEDLESFYNEYLTAAPKLSCDIETKDLMITCVGFSGDEKDALVIPFYSYAQSDGNFWRTKREEYLAWVFVRRMLTLPHQLSFGQNFQYDMQYFLKEMGIKSTNFGDDTMLLHHVLQPEMKKGLGFLASIYTDETAWKSMHKTSYKDKTTKKEDT